MVFLPDDDSQQRPFRPDLLPAAAPLFDEHRVASRHPIVTGNAGMLWRISEQLSAGLFYRQGAKVSGTTTFATGPAGVFPFAASTTADLKIPDVGGGGLAWRSPDGHVTQATEVDHVGYSGLVKVRSTEDLVVISRTYSDAWEYHFGAEYAVIQWNRSSPSGAGYWVEANGDDLLQRRFNHVTAGLGIAAPVFQIDLAGDLSNEGNRFAVSLIYNF